MTMDYQKIGQRIRELRKAQGLSQEQLAEKVWISTTHMSHIETASTKLSLPVLVDIAGALNASVDDIIFGHAASLNARYSELSAIMDTCSPSQVKLLVEIMKSVKNHLDEYGKESY